MKGISSKDHQVLKWCPYSHKTAFLDSRSQLVFFDFVIDSTELDCSRNTSSSASGFWERIALLYSRLPAIQAKTDTATRTVHRLSCFAASRMDFYKRR